MYACNLITQTFFGLQIFDMYGKDRLGQYRSGLFMSGHVRMEYLLPNIFGSEIIMDPKYFGWLQIINNWCHILAIAYYVWLSQQSKV